MPELPEVQTVVNSLQPTLPGKIIQSVQCPNGYTGVFENGNINDLRELCIGTNLFGLSNYSISNNMLITSLSNASKREIVILNLNYYSEIRKTVPFSGIKYLVSDEKMTCFISGTTTSPETVTYLFLKASDFLQLITVSHMLGFILLIILNSKVLRIICLH